VSFIVSSPFHEGDIRQCADNISQVFKENFSELELEITKFQNRLITNNCRDQQTLWNAVSSARYPVLNECR